MRSSDLLHQLIKSLSKGERRNFKLFSKLQDGNKNYSILFEAIDSQDTYDEKEILKQFEGERFTRQFSVAKNYLFNFILRTLHIFDKSPNAELKSLLHQVSLLMEKNLYPHAEKLLRKALHQAERQEKFREMLEALHYQRLILHHSSRMREFEAFIEEIEEREKDTLKKLENLQAYQHLMDKIYLCIRKAEQARKAKDLSTFKDIIDDPLIQNPQNALSTRAKLLRHLTLEDCYRYAGEIGKCLSEVRRVIDVYQEAEWLRKEQNLKYIFSLNNHCAYSFMLNRFEEAAKTLEVLKSVPANNTQEEISIFERYYTLKLSICIDSGSVNQGEKIIADFEKEFPRKEGLVRKSFEFTHYHKVAYFYLMAGEASKALPWINRILNEGKTELKTDIQCSARLLNLFIHYELGNFDVLDYKLKSAYRFIYKRNRLFGYEKTVLKHLKKMIATAQTDKRDSAIQAFSKELKEVLENSFEKGGLHLFDAGLWLEAKIERVRMADIKKANFDKRKKEKAL